MSRASRRRLDSSCESCRFSSSQIAHCYHRKREVCAVQPMASRNLSADTNSWLQVDHGEAMRTLQEAQEAHLRREAEVSVDLAYPCIQSGSLCVAHLRFEPMSHIPCLRSKLGYLVLNRLHKPWCLVVQEQLEDVQRCCNDAVARLTAAEAEAASLRQVRAMTIRSLMSRDPLLCRSLLRVSTDQQFTMRSPEMVVKRSIILHEH